MTPAIIIHPAKILFFIADGCTNESVVDELSINKRTIFLWMQKNRDHSADETLYDILSVSKGKDPNEGIPGKSPKMDYPYCLPKTERSWICNWNMDKFSLNQIRSSTRGGSLVFTSCNGFGKHCVQYYYE